MFLLSQYLATPAPTLKLHYFHISAYQAETATYFTCQMNCAIFLLSISQTNPSLTVIILIRRLFANIDNANNLQGPGSSESLQYFDSCRLVLPGVMLVCTNYQTNTDSLISLIQNNCNSCPPAYPWAPILTTTRVRLMNLPSNNWREIYRVFHSRCY